MFKIGDKIIAKYLRSNCASHHDGKILTIKDVIMAPSNETVWYYGVKEYRFGIYPDECLPYKKKELTCEADYLDAFQKNFKEGI